MQLGVFMEGYVRPEQSANQRLREILVQARFAEDVGLDSIALSEQHFKHPTNSTSSPDVMFGAISSITSRIRLVPLVVVLPLHNPLAVAERWATIDTISQGRVVFGIGRGNTPVTADVFNVPIPETEERTVEGMRHVLSAWLDDEAESNNGYYSFDSISVTPKPEQRPHPPLYWAATSPGSHERGGSYGFGLMTGGNAMDLEQVKERIARYRKGLANCTPLHSGQEIRNHVIMAANGHVATSMREARLQAEEYILEYVGRTVGMYQKMVSRSGKPNVDFSKATRFVDDFEANISAGTMVMGSPKDCIAQLERIHAAGVDEVLVRMDGPTHEEIMSSIELLGKEVLPAVSHLSRTPAEAPKS